MPLIVQDRMLPLRRACFVGGLSKYGLNSVFDCLSVSLSTLACINLDFFEFMFDIIVTLLIFKIFFI